MLVFITWHLSMAQEAVFLGKMLYRDQELGKFFWIVSKGNVVLFDPNYLHLWPNVCRLLILPYGIL